MSPARPPQPKDIQFEDTPGEPPPQPEEAPVEEAPVEEAPVEEAPVEETPIEEASIEEAPVEEEEESEFADSKPRKKGNDEPDFQDLVLAIAEVESSFGQNLHKEEPKYKWTHEPKKWAKKFGHSEEVELEQQKASYGPLQIMVATARELGFDGEDLYELRGKAGVIFGIKYLRKLGKQHKNWEDAVAAYNAGSPRREKDGSYVNQGYVNKVKEALKNVGSRYRR